jgi:lysophospholipase L1-like esterase
MKMLITDKRMKSFTTKYKKIKAFVFFGSIGIKRRIREVLGKQTFYVIGDSHVQCFQHEFFRIFHIGPSTAYKLGFKQSTTGGRQKVIKILNKIYKNKPLNVIFVFGELDVRIHINKAVKEKKISLNDAVKKTVNSYMNFLILIKKKYPYINIYVYNILPQGEEKNIYNFPYYAAKARRRIIAEKLNRELKEQSALNTFKFVYIYNNLIDENKNRKKEYIFDDVHFNRKTMPFVINAINRLTFKL